MTQVFTPSIDLALGVLLTLALTGLAILARRIYNRHCVLKKQFRVVESTGDLESLKKSLEFLDPPFALEIAVHQLGRDIHSYLAIPAGRADKFIQRTGAKEVPDYNIYHPGGAHIGGSLAVKGASNACLDVFIMHLLKDLDFSKVNEVGEGVVFQLVFGSRHRDGTWLGNTRILVSAPTPYQAREILSDLEKELSGCKWIEEKDKDFLNAVTYREFDSRKGMVWTL